MERISRTEYVRSAIADKADLSAFKAKPSFRVKLGIAIVLFIMTLGFNIIADRISHRFHRGFTATK